MSLVEEKIQWAIITFWLGTPCQVSSKFFPIPETNTSVNNNKIILGGLMKIWFENYCKPWFPEYFPLNSQIQQEKQLKNIFWTKNFQPYEVFYCNRHLYSFATLFVMIIMQVFDRSLGGHIVWSFSQSSFLSDPYRFDLEEAKILFSFLVLNGLTIMVS